MASRSTHGVIPPTKYNPSILKFALTTTYTTNWWTISLKFHGQVFQKNIFKNPQKTIKQTVNKQTWNDVSCFAFVSVRWTAKFDENFGWLVIAFKLFTEQVIFVFKQHIIMKVSEFFYNFSTTDWDDDIGDDIPTLGASALGLVPPAEGLYQRLEVT